MMFGMTRLSRHCKPSRPDCDGIPPGHRSRLLRIIVRSFAEALRRMKSRFLKVIVAVVPLLVAGVAQADDGADRARRRTPIVELFEKCRDAVVNISTTRVREMRSPMGGSVFDDIFNFNR